MRKPDRYETRARELALAAGVDPDSRIERPGQRSMPAWCAYRDAARKEHLAAEAAEAERSIAANSPQAPRYVNSPLRVFGRHDDATIAQMRNCMAVGNVVGGVICADGHLGYAQPVGMRWKPCGNTCIRKRWMNSEVSSVITLYRWGPSMR